MLNWFFSNSKDNKMAKLSKKKPVQTQLGLSLALFFISAAALPPPNHPLKQPTTHPWKLIFQQQLSFKS